MIYLKSCEKTISEVRGEKGPKGKDHACIRGHIKDFDPLPKSNQKFLKCIFNRNRTLSGLSFKKINIIAVSGLRCLRLG